MKRRDVEESQEPILEQSMEYMGAVGTMLLDELACIVEGTERGLGTTINDMERQVMRVDDQMTEQYEDVWVCLQEAEETIDMLVVNIWRKTHEIDVLERLYDQMEDIVNVHMAWMKAMYQVTNRLLLEDTIGIMDGGDPLTVLDFKEINSDSGLEDSRVDSSEEEEVMLVLLLGLQGLGQPGGAYCGAHWLVLIKKLTGSGGGDLEVDLEMAVAIAWVDLTPQYTEPPAYEE